MLFTILAIIGYIAGGAISAIVIVPYFTTRKMKSLGIGSIDEIKATLRTEVSDVIEEAIPKVFESETFKAHIETFKKEQLESLPQVVGAAFNSEEFGGWMEDMLVKALQHLEGAIYAQLGLSKQEVEKGVQALSGAINSLPEGMDIALPPELGMFGPMLQGFMENEDMSDMAKMAVMIAIQKFMPGLIGGQTAQKGAVKGLQPPR